MGIQYSYLTRDTWVAYGKAATGNVYPGGTIQPQGIENMVFTSFRYYLP